MPAKKKPAQLSFSVERLTPAKTPVKNSHQKGISSCVKNIQTEENIQTIEITTLWEYIQLIEECCVDDYILFRGQNTDWPLLPKLCRLNSREGSIIETERKMLEDFKRLSKPHLSKIPTNDWEWIALAQHHGMPTRLLDWSTNPLAALWFAVEKACSSKHGVVWIFFLEETHFLTPDELCKIDPFKENSAKVFQPELSTIRIQSQSGWFTTQQFHAGRNFVAFDKLPKYRKNFLKLIIPRQVFSSLRYQLDRLGVNRFALFQDLDGIASYIEWNHTVGDDEESVEEIDKKQKRRFGSKTDKAEHSKK